ncbi:ATP-binding protein [Caulobacter sp. ErkDOM-E]|uniref:ATP-binding protein n=1 Tax=Caulobacter sp. ErkDOM-E TaxID=3402778 RepID=UPI003AF60EDD
MPKSIYLHTAPANWRKLTGLSLAYTACMAYSLLLAEAASGLPTIWTANAVVVAGLLALPRSDRWALLGLTLLLHVLIQLPFSMPLPHLLLVSCLDTLQVAAIATVLRMLRLPGRVRDMRSLTLLVSISALLTAASSVCISGLLAVLRGQAFWTGWNDWTMPNVLGMALALPTVLILLDTRLMRGFRLRPLEASAMALIAALTAAAVFSTQPLLQSLLFAPALLAVFLGGPRAVALVVTASLAATIPAVIRKTGIDPDSALPPLRQALMFHIVLYGVCMVAALALSRQARLQTLLLRGQAVARAAQARAIAANAAKSDFLATISHEIRTPLNSVLGFAGLVADDPGLSAESRRRLDLVGRAGRSLAGIVNDLLDFAKVEAGRMDLNLAPASPARLLGDAVAIVAPAAEAKGLRLTMSLHGDETGKPAVFALDEVRLGQVLLNLLANAVKFTAAGEVSARMDLDPSAGAIRFEIADTGIGIASEVQPRLFQRFSQADTSISRSYGGAGLGLAISKALINQMGGQIGVQSVPDQGSRFWITLPATPVDATETVGAGSLEMVIPGASRVLLVDDHPMNRELGHALLTLAGCVVTTAENGAQAVASARDGGFDLILMDVHMPIMDGLAATRAIRALPGAVASTPIIALSADVMPEQIARCRLAGMNDHVAKPIHRESLIAAVMRALVPEVAAPSAALGSS